MADGEGRPLATEKAGESTQLIGPWARRLLIPFASLQNREFRLLWFGQLGQGSAMRAEQVAQSWLTWQLSSSATAIGLVFLFRAIPLMTLGLLGGVIADRFDKRKVLIVIQIWSLSIYVAMAILLLGGWIRLWHVYLSAFLLGSGMAMNQPVRTSFIPQLLEGRLLVNALSLNSIAINVARLVVPAAIGFLIDAAGGNVGPAYVVASALFVMVLLSTMMIRVGSRPLGDRGASIGRGLIEGFRYMLLENRTVLALIVLAMGPLAFGFSYIVLLPVFVTEVLHMGPSTFGLLQSIGAVGGLAGGFTLASVGKVPHKGKVLLLTGLTYGLMVMLLGSSPALLGGLPALLGRLSALLDGLPVLIFAFGAIAILVASASQTIFRAANNSTLLEITPRRLQGRVVGLTFLDMGAQSLAAVLAGTVTDIWNVSVGFAVIGAICLAIVALIGLGAPAVRRL